MANTEQKTPAAPKRGWLKKLGIVFGALLVLLVVAYFVCTSESFFKGAILPRVGKAMNATITADSASISPFSQVTLKGVKLQTTGTEPLLTVTELRARYSLMAILGGTLKIEEVLIDSPVVNVIENADGTCNASALGQGAKAESKPAPSAAGKPPQVDLKNFTLKNATVRYTMNHPGGTHNTVELTGINVTLDDVKNGAAGKFAFALAGKADLNPPDATKRGTMTGKHDGKYTFTLGPDLMPAQISGSDHTDVTQATGALADMANTGVDFVAEMSPTEIKGIAITFRKGGASLGEMRLSGPFDALKREGKLTLALTGIDRKLLNLAGTMTGMDFGSTTINSTNTIEITQGGALVTVGGRLGIADLQVTRTGQTTPTLQLGTDYALTVDSGKSSATLRALNINGTQNGRALLKSELSSPMTFAWGSSASAVGDASLALTLTELNLADWKPFLGGSVAGGKINASLKLLSQEAGKKLGIEMASEIQNLSTDPSLPNTLSAKSHLNAALINKDDTMNVAGKLTVDELISRSGAKELRVPATTVDFNVTKTADVIELKQFLAKLAPTGRAKNELTLTGRVDMAKPDAITGGFKLTADALDLTAYYDLISGDPTATKPAAKPAAAPAPAATEKEPDAMTLPFRNFTCDVNLARVYLREVDVANLQATAKLDGSKMTVKPVQLTLNGTPITASLDANLGVPGFQYEFTFDAPNVPLAPLVNSFQPDRKGQIGGTATAFANLKGAGVTGASLQKNLTGQFDLVATNLNLALSEVRTPVIKSLINIVVAIPDAISNPEAALVNLTGRLLGAKKESGGAVDEFMKSPINGIVAHGTAGGGKIELKQAFVESSAFRGDATGTIEIASVLTNSVMRFPVSIALAKGVSDKLGLTPANTASNAVYVAMPDFVKMGGTLGVPKPDVKYLVLAKIALKSGAGILGNTGGAAQGQVGNAVGTLNTLLGGKPATTTSTNLTTNAASAAPAADLIRGLGGLLGGKKKPAQTNPPVEQPKP